MNVSMFHNTLCRPKEGFYDFGQNACCKMASLKKHTPAMEHGRRDI